jgi:hypothetical protein
VLNGDVNGVVKVQGVWPVANGGTNASSAGIAAFNNITGYTAAGATGTTSTNLVFSTAPTLVTPTLGAALSTSLNNSGAITTGTLNFAADAQVSDTYVITLAPAPSAYATGMLIVFTATTANTGACTINVNALGAKALKRGVSTDPGDNFIKAGSVVMAVYDGTNFQMIQPAAQ